MMKCGVNNMKKYKVTQKFMGALEEWKAAQRIDYVVGADISMLPNIVDDWWFDDKRAFERNNRLIAIIQWLNGEDVFELEQPHKFVVRAFENVKFDNFWYVFVNQYNHISNTYSINVAKKFDTPEEAQKYCVPGYEVIEIDSDGNEVE